MPATVKTLDERVDDLADRVGGLTREFTTFKSKVESSLSLLRWVGVFAAGVVVTVILGVISVAHSAGKVEATVEQLRESNRELKSAVEDQSKLLRELAREVSEVRAKVK